MTAKEHLYRIADLIGTNLAFDFFDWEKLTGEIQHLTYLDEHTLDMVQAQVVEASSIRAELNFVIETFPEKEALLEVLNYLGLLMVRPNPEESIGSREVLEKDFSAKQRHWGRDFHLLLTVILVFDKSGMQKLENSVYALADLAARILRERRNKDVS
jgi:hypothetical protein